MQNDTKDGMNTVAEIALLSCLASLLVLNILLIPNFHVKILNYAY